MMMKKSLLLFAFCALLSGVVGFVFYKGVPDDIIQRINNYFEKLPAEKLYVHFAEDVWVAGQEVWCKAYLVNAKDFTPASESKVVYLEVINARGTIVQKLNLNASNGLARGNFSLSDSLSTGWYQVNAYTRWMQNFETASHFSKPVLLVNPLRDTPGNITGASATVEERNMKAQKPVLLEIDETATGNLQVQIIPEDDNFPGKNVYLVAVSGEEIVYSEMLELDKGAAQTEVPVSGFVAGTMQLALFDEEAALLDAREIFHSKPSEVALKVTPDKTSGAPREKASLTLSLSRQDGKPLDAFASVSIRKKEAISDQLPPTNIAKYLYGGNAPREKKASDAPLGGAKESRFTAINLASGFPWTKAVGRPVADIQYPKEDEGILISGKLLTLQGQPIADERVILSVTGKNLWFQYDYTKADGSFNLLIERVFGEKEVVIQAPELKDEYQIVLEEERKSVQPTGRLPTLTLDTQTLEEFIQKCRQRERINNTYNFYRQDSVANSSNKKRQEAPFRFYGVPNVELYLEDFIDLPNMEEVCRELLPGVQLKIKGDEYNFNVFDVRTRTFLPNEPELFVDGVLVYDKSQIVGLLPESIEKIETVNRRTFYGDFRFDGVISIFTTAGNMYESMLPPAALKTSLSFYNQPELFPLIDHQEEEIRIPDLQTLIYWNPDVKFDAAGKLTLAYHHSDETGTFEIVVEGITPDGIPFSQKVEYEVAFH